MPFINAGAHDSTAAAGIEIFYRTYGRGPARVLMIIGEVLIFHDSWEPQIKGLVGTVTPNDEESPVDGRSCEVAGGGAGYEDNDYGKRCYSSNGSFGMGKSSCIWAFDGCYVACKLADNAPARVLFLALLNVTGGGYECMPKFDRKTLSIAMRFLREKTPEQRAPVDLDTHYSQEYLEEYVGQKTRRSILHQEYVKGISSTGMQSSYGFDGQINACWTHKMSQTEIESIRVAGFPVSVLHGRHDVIAQVCHAKILAEKLYSCARMVELNGGHLVSHEKTEEVNKALVELTMASECRISLYKWTNLSDNSSGSKATRISLWRTSSSSFIVESVEKLHVFQVYLFSLFTFVLEHLRRAMSKHKPVRVGSALT